jgi:hypothetical protein
MKTLSVLPLLLLCQDSSTLTMPVEGDAAAAVSKLTSLPLEFYACEKKCPIGDNPSFERCERCGGAIQSPSPVEYPAPKAEFREGLIHWTFQAQKDLIGVLRLSRLDAALKEAGVTRSVADAVERGRFQIHLGGKPDMEAAKAALQKLPGILTIRAETGILYVDADTVLWTDVQKALETFEISDVTWIVTQDGGLMGFSRKSS